MKIFSYFLCALSMLFSVSAAWAQGTGTRLGTPSEQPTSIIRFVPPGEIDEMRQLIANGEAEKAVKLGEWLVKSDPASDIQYAGHNALCAAYSSAGNLDKAMESCNKAIDIRSSHWMAINSRGTVYFLMGRMDEAVADYRAALSLLKDKSREADVVRHNIALAEARKSNGS